MSRAISTRSPTGIAGVRTWAYIAHRADWLADPAAMAERTREVEEKLSDALHERLTQRFVDRRTSVLLRDIGRKGAGEFPVIVDEEGEVTVGSYPDRADGGLRLRGRSGRPPCRPQDAARHRRAAARRRI